MEKITEVNCKTGEVIERELTADEVAQRKIDEENEIACQLSIAQKATAKAALLAKLGITEDEAALLLGGN